VEADMKRALLLIAACALVYAFVAWSAAARLPEDRVALHVNTAGEVDESASRAGAITYFFSTYFFSIGGVLLVLAIAVLCMCRFVPVRFLNMPNKDYWAAPERAQTARQMILWDCAVIFGMPFLALSFIPINVALLSENPNGTSALWTIVPIAVWLIAMIGYVVWMVARRYRKPS
jgi:hypothetical protein